jgi:hypothetical protein
VRRARPRQSGPESSVGYVDSAIPIHSVHLRYDSAHRDNAPDRAEVFYARLRSPFAPNAPGLPG